MQKKKQRSGSETISYLEMKHKDELELRKQQLELQRENQQQMHAFMQQQQQVNVALLTLMNKMHDKYSVNMHIHVFLRFCFRMILFCILYSTIYIFIVNPTYPGPFCFGESPRGLKI